MAALLATRRGVTLVELVVTVTILGILASVVMPLAQMTAKRTRELELRRNLRTIRTAIDEYKKAYDKQVAENKGPDVINESGYPESLEVLVEGHDFKNLKDKKKFLRRIPRDPFNPPTGKDQPKWGLRSSTDKPDYQNSNGDKGGDDVYDVYSLNEGTAIDGTKYSDW